MSEDRGFYRPVRRSAGEFDRLFGSTDPADVAQIAHRTAESVVARARASDSQAVIDRLVSYTDTFGIEAVAELWSHAAPISLPGALWRLYLLQLMIHDDAETAALLYRRGTSVLVSADPVVVGAPDPASPTVDP